MPDRVNNTSELIASDVDNEDYCNGVSVESSQCHMNTTEMNQDIRRNRKRKLNVPTSTSENRVYVSNIPLEVSWQELEDLFAREIGKVTDSSLSINDDGESLGYGSITFENIESVHQATKKMNGFLLGNRKLVVREYPRSTTGLGHDYPAKKSKFTRTIWSESHPNKTDFHLDNDWKHESYGISKDFLRYWNINLPLICRVHVTNLDPRIDKQKLREIFELAGRVVHVELRTTADRNKKFGKIEYEHPIESVQAISMLHQQFMYDLRMNVRMDRSGESGPDSLILPEGLKNIGMGLGKDGAPLKNIHKLMNDYDRPSAMQLVTSVITDPAFFNIAGKLSQHVNELTRKLHHEAQEKTKLFDQQFSQQKLELEKLINDFSSKMLRPVNGDAVGLRKGIDGGRPTYERVTPGRGHSYGSNVNPINLKRIFGGSNVAGNKRPLMGVAAKRFEKPLGFRNTYGVSNVDRTYGKPRGTSSSIYVRNLPANVTWKMLRNKFQEVGNVRYVEVGDGDAKIHFNTVADANQAIARFDSSRYYNEILNVRLL